MLKKIITTLFIIVIPFIMVSEIFAQENKTALIIGNSLYSHFPPLAQPAIEAQEMKDALHRLGFDVTLLLDGTQDEMYGALSDFEYKLKSRGGLAFFHYGGHGIQVDGSNYLIPVDADIPDARRVKSRTLDVEEILGVMESSGSDTNVIILDACRDNPLPGVSRSATRGLAAVHRPPPNSIIVYSADAGDTAQDGLFTPTLLKYIETPGAEFSSILRDVRRDVLTASGGRQRTGEYNQLISEVFLAGRSGSISRIPVEPNHLERPDGGKGMVFVPGGTFSMGSTDRDGHATPIHSVIVSDFWIGGHEVTQAEWQKVMGTTLRRQRDTANREWPLKGEGDDYPIYYVSWEDAVDYCNSLSLQQGLTPCYSGNGKSIRCNFNANGYRLPTEAEWEYAARGGINGRDTLYAGGDSLDSLGWYDGNSHGSTHPVGRKTPNELGLYDITGNVSEWCWDWYANYSSGSLRNPTGAPSGTFRVYRGGSHYESTYSSGVYYRSNAPQGMRSFAIGFRLVRRP